MFSLASKNITCTFRMEKGWRTCEVDQIINSEDYVIASPFNATVQQFYIYDEDEVIFLPRNINEKFPNLQQFYVAYTGLTDVRPYYFKNMSNLSFLALSFNKISRIESSAFKDLVSLKNLWLHENMIQTLDEKLFNSMTGLEKIWLFNNRIEFLGPTTFKIPNGKLSYVDLEENVCNLGLYSNSSVNQLESDINANCSKIEPVPAVSMLTNSKRSFIQGEH